MYNRVNDKGRGAENRKGKRGEKISKSDLKEGDESL